MTPREKQLRAGLCKVTDCLSELLVREVPPSEKLARVLADGLGALHDPPCYCAETSARNCPAHAEPDPPVEKTCRDCTHHACTVEDTGPCGTCTRMYDDGEGDHWQPKPPAEAELVKLKEAEPLYQIAHFLERIAVALERK